MSKDGYTQEQIDRHGIYKCSCGEEFVGHWNRVAHMSKCEVMTKRIEDSK